MKKPYVAALLLITALTPGRLNGQVRLGLPSLVSERTKDMDKKVEVASTPPVLIFNVVHYRDWEGQSDGFSALAGSTHTVSVTDVRQYLKKFEVSRDHIREGDPVGGLTWETIYESSGEMLTSERTFLPVVLPPGEYVSFRITQRNLMYWVVDHQGDILDLASLNDDTKEADAMLVGHIGDGGFFPVEGGVFDEPYADEKIGGFEMRNGVVTKLTSRMNLSGLDWYDHDDSGDWSEGDEISNWTVPPGVTTMSDFLVSYE